MVASQEVLMILNLGGGAGMNAETEEKIDAIYGATVPKQYYVEMKANKIQYPTGTNKIDMTYDVEIIDIQSIGSGGDVQLNGSVKVTSDNAEVILLANEYLLWGQASRSAVYLVIGKRGVSSYNVVVTQANADRIPYTTIRGVK